MHPNPVYHTADDAKNLAFAAERGFGTLAVNGDGGPMLSHVPFILTGGTAELHLVRSNPIARALSEPLPAALAVTGADSYISPDWYGIADQVPTWNYIAVHLRGRLERRPDDALLDLLDRQSDAYEARLLPKTPWTTAKMDREALARLMRMIVPCRLHIETVDGTWKFSQNKADEVRLAAADEVEEHGFGSDVAALAKAMRGA